MMGSRPRLSESAPNTGTRIIWIAPLSKVARKLPAAGKPSRWMAKLGMSADDIFAAYVKKNEVNFKRQDSGYAVKDESDSKHI